LVCKAREGGAKRDGERRDGGTKGRRDRGSHADHTKARGRKREIEREGGEGVEQGKRDLVMRGIFFALFSLLFLHFFSHNRPRTTGFASSGISVRRLPGARSSLSAVTN
jgi:hypothetical protein